MTQAFLINHFQITWQGAQAIIQTESRARGVQGLYSTMMHYKTTGNQFLLSTGAKLFFCDYTSSWWISGYAYDARDTQPYAKYARASK